MKRNHVLGAALAVALVASGAVLGPKLVSAADPLGPPAMGDEGPEPGDGGPRHHQGPGGHMGMHHFRPGAHLDGKLAFLKAELKIQPSQEKVWSSFDGALRKSAKALEARHEANKGGKHWPELTTPERLDKLESGMTARLDALRAVKGETKALYAALTPDQQKSFDELFAGPMRPM